MLNWRTAFAGVAVSALVVAVAPAGADQIYNSLDGSVDASVENITLGVGGNDGTVTFAVKPKNGDGKSGCNLTSSSSLVASVASSSTSVATLDKSSLTFTSCGSTQTIKVHPVAVGTSTITLAQTSNTSTGSFQFTTATFTVKVVSSAPPNTAPVLNLPSNITVPATNAAGAAVTYTATATDAEDNPDPTPLCVPESGSTFPIGTTTVNCAVTDSGGLQTTGSFTVTVGDTEAPIVSISASGTATAAGWRNIATSGSSGVTVSVSATDNVGVTSLECTDNGSSVTLSAAKTFVIGDGTHAIVCTAKDAANNSGSNNATYKVDQTNPTITATAVAPANAAGWNNANVTISYVCADATSGIEGSCPGDVVVSTEGTTTTSRTVSDQAGNSATASTTVKLDKSNPTISGSTDRAANANGWYNAPVTVSFTCSDALSDIKTCSAPTTLGEGANQSVTGTAVDNADNSSAALVSGVNVDQTAPHITFTRTASNGAGWNNTDVVITFDCTDGLSGVDSVTSPITVSTEGPGQSRTGTCIDKAGNSASVTVADINIDKTKPVISSTRSPDANQYGWNNGAVVVGFSCTDGGSGLATNTVAGQTVTTDGANQSVTNSGDCVDEAGNVADSVTVADINIDTTKPVITGSATTSPNGNGWYNADVTVTFQCDDSGTVKSGITDDSSVTGATLSGDGANQSVPSNGSCTDKAGNSADATSVDGINIDKTKPAIVGSRTPAANPAGWNNTDVTVAFTCVDGGSGPTAASVLTGGTLSAEGTNLSVTSSGTCEDLAGNQAAAPVTVGGINIDKTAPVIAGTATSSPNSNGWYNADVTFHVTCAETGAVQSGVVTDSVQDATISAEGTGLTKQTAGSCVDAAGNAAAQATVGPVNIDKTAPALNPSVSPNPVVLNGSATASAGATDTNGSGIDTSSCAAVNTSSVGTGKSVSCTATDKAGNVGSGSATYSVVYATTGGCLGSAGHAILQPINGDGSSVFKLGSTVPAKFRVCDANGNSIGAAGTVSGFKLVSKTSASGSIAVNEDVTSTTPDTAFRWSTTDSQWIYNISTKATSANGFQSNMKLSYLITLNDGSTIPFTISLK